MTVLPLVVLVHDGPLARAYLATMRRAGLMAEAVLIMVESRHPHKKKPMGGWLPRRSRMWYAERVQERAQHYWPRRIQAKHSNLVRSMADEMSKICDEPLALYREMLGRFDYEAYAQRTQRVFVRGIGDPALASELRRLSPQIVLYTGGGRVPPNVLEIPRIGFLHVHPGHLPDVRGADGLLWSVLFRGRPSMSCFYMSPEIDVGDVIATSEYPALRFDISRHRRPDDQTLYRALFSFCDPVLRAVTLVEKVLRCRKDLCGLPAEPQAPEQGDTYYFMHPTLRRRVLDQLFYSNGDPGRTGADDQPHAGVGMRSADNASLSDVPA